MYQLQVTLEGAMRKIRSLTNPEARSKGQIGDIVTAADLASEQYICARLKEAYPHCKILTEETVTDVTEENFASHSLVFLIDPLDGTTNFKVGIPVSALSIGAYSFGQPMDAVILSYPDGVAYRAVQGKGIKKDGEMME